MKTLTIGKKIKELRLEKGMTQAELAGETVTRNMMSQIEHENALPSVHTILDISERLGVPAEYFFSDMNEPAPFYKMYDIEKIRKLYVNKEYVKCIRRLEKLNVWDDETEYLYAKSCFGKGLEQYRKGNLISASEFFEKAKIHAEKTNYLEEDFLGFAEQYLNAVEMIRKKETEREDHTQKIKRFLAETTYPALVNQNVKTSLTCHPEQTEIPYMPWHSDLDSPYAQHLTLRANIKTECSSEEAENLKIALRNLLETLDENEYAVLKYYVLCDLEYLSKITEDYKSAYECSNARLVLSEKMNT